MGQRACGWVVGGLWFCPKTSQLTFLVLRPLLLPSLLDPCTPLHQQLLHTLVCGPATRNSGSTCTVQLGGIAPACQKPFDAVRHWNNGPKRLNTTAS